MKKNNSAIAYKINEFKNILENNNINLEKINLFSNQIEQHFNKHNAISQTFFNNKISLLSRYIKKNSIAIHQQKNIEGLNIKCDTLEMARLILILSRPDINAPEFSDSYEKSFTYADHGETRALYLALPFLPHPEKYLWRAGEACRTNMLPIFEAVACESPYPSQYFNELSWNQMVLKAAFLDVPLWRIMHFDSRLNTELSRMALDYMDERISANREIPASLWLCLGTTTNTKSQQRFDWAACAGKPHDKIAAAYALLRRGEQDAAIDMINFMRNPSLNQIFQQQPKSLFTPDLMASIMLQYSPNN